MRRQSGVDKDAAVGELRNWLEKKSVELRQDHDARFYTKHEFVSWHWDRKRAGYLSYSGRSLRMGTAVTPCPADSQRCTPLHGFAHLYENTAPQARVALVECTAILLLGDQHAGC